MSARYNPDIHYRHSIRLRGYDYSQNGAYFVTICTQDRECLFGNVVNKKMVLNDAGLMVRSVWNEIPTHYSGFELHDYVIMPNHFHGITMIVGAGPRGCPDPAQPRETGQPRGVAPTGLSLSDIVHRFKTMTTKQYADGVKQNNWQPFDKRLWQRNYYEHIIRNENEYNRIAEYIIRNPQKRKEDTLWTN